MRETKKLWAMLVLLSFATMFAQDKKPDAQQGPPSEVWGPESERVMIEFGFRTYWGDVYGRPDLPFKPGLAGAKFNEYSDVRKNVYIRRSRVNLENIFGTDAYLNYQTQSAFYRNQSHLVTVEIGRASCRERV